LRHLIKKTNLLDFRDLRTRKVLVRLMGGLGRRSAGLESQPPRRIVAVGNEFRYESGLGGRFRDRYGLRHGRDESHRGFAVSRNPTQGASIAHLIVGLERRALRFFTSPTCMGEPVRVLTRWIAAVDVTKRSLSEREQEARRNAKLDRAPHFP
jgi:hypothetical protein